MGSRSGMSLRSVGFQLLLVNARQVKLLAGRAVGAWAAAGQLRAPAAIRELRDLTRYRKRLIQAHTAEGQRVQRPWRTRASSWTRSPPTCLGSPAGRCWSP